MFETTVQEIKLETLQRCEGAEDLLPVSLATSYEVPESCSFGSGIQKRPETAAESCCAKTAHKESPQLAFQMREVQKRQEAAPVHLHPEVPKDD